MVSGRGLPVSIGIDVSQCADAMSTARGRGNVRPRSAQARPAMPASIACMGEPCERKTVGKVMTSAPDLSSRGDGVVLPDQAFRDHRLADLRTPRNPHLV